nr:hypothetical protein [uncultured Trichococcus sp.]
MTKKIFYKGVCVRISDEGLLAGDGRVKWKLISGEGCLTGGNNYGTVLFSGKNRLTGEK